MPNTTTASIPEGTKRKRFDNEEVSSKVTTQAAAKAEAKASAAAVAATFEVGSEDCGSENKSRRTGSVGIEVTSDKRDQSSSSLRNELLLEGPCEVFKDDVGEEDFCCGLKHAQYWDQKDTELTEVIKSCSDDFEKIVLFLETVPYMRQITESLQNKIKEFSKVSLRFAEQKRQLDALAAESGEGFRDCPALVDEGEHVDTNDGSHEDLYQVTDEAILNTFGKVDVELYYSLNDYQKRLFLNSAREKNGKVKQEAKRADMEAKRADMEAKRADMEAKRADMEAKRADMEAKRADMEAKKAEMEAKKADMEAKRADLTDKRAAINDEAHNIRIHVKDVSSKAAKLYNLVSVLAGLSQADITKTYTHGRQAKTKKVSQGGVRETTKEDPEAKWLPAIVNGAQDEAMDELYKNVKVIEGIFAEEVLLTNRKTVGIEENFYPCDTSALKRLSNIYNKAVENCQIMKPKMFGKKRYAKNIKELLRRFTMVTKTCTMDENTWFNQDFYFPGSVCQEFYGVEKVLKHLLLSIGANLNSNSCFERDSPPKSNILSQRRFRGSNKRRQRIVDAVVSVRGAHKAFIIRDDSVDVMMEIKPGQRGTGGPIKMMYEMREQVASHMAKQGGRGMNFGGGIGISTFSTGVIASLGYVQILQLHVIDPGTLDSHLELRATRLLPLMTEINFKHWYTSDICYKEHQDEWIKLEQILYPKVSMPNEDTIDSILLSNCSNRVKDDDDVLLGWKALWFLMSSSRKDLAGGWSDQKNLGDIIGYGTFSNVFAKKEEDCVTKVSICGRRLHIANEVKYLEHLGNGDNYPDSLTRLKGRKMYQLSIGGVTCPLPCVQLSPRGTSLAFHILKLSGNGTSNNDMYWSAVQTIGEGMKDALDFIHEHEVCHNDVSFKNIVIKGERPVLIDFGNAAKLGSRQKGFLGTTEFVHRRVHISSKNWHCRSEYDVASLGFTLATIMRDGVVSWSGLSSGIVSDPGSSVFEERLFEARKIVQNAEGFNDTVRKLWLSWIDFDTQSCI